MAGPVWFSHQPLDLKALEPSFASLPLTNPRAKKQMLSQLMVVKWDPAMKVRDLVEGKLVAIAQCVKPSCLPKDRSLAIKKKKRGTEDEAEKEKRAWLPVMQKPATQGNESICMRLKQGRGKAIVSTTSGEVSYGVFKVGTNKDTGKPVYVSCHQFLCWVKDLVPPGYAKDAAKWEKARAAWRKKLQQRERDIGKGKEVGEAPKAPTFTSQHLVRHLCGCKGCVNPSHLQWGSKSENELEKAAMVVQGKKGGGSTSLRRQRGIRLVPHGTVRGGGVV